MATYAEYLKSLGASEEEIKILDTPVAQRAYTNMVADAEAARRNAAETKAAADAYEARANSWFEEQNEKFLKVQKDGVAAAAEAARFKTALMKAHEQGMIDVAKDLGFDPNPPAPPSSATPPAFDPDKYTRDVILPLAEREGDAIALAQDLSVEHEYLFGTKLRNFRELRREAVAAKKPVEQYWMEKFGVVAARQKKADEEREAERKKWMQEGAKARETELLSQFANPDLRTPEASRSPFVPRPTGSIRNGKQPWETGPEALSQDRVARATEKVLRETSGRPN